MSKGGLELVMLVIVLVIEVEGVRALSSIMFEVGSVTGLRYAT